MTRFRLRFLLQEIDLPQGDTLVGRSAACQVTLDDPLVSREHARIRISGGEAVVEDLGSRNGVQLGGQPISGVAPLTNGDRLRIGTQEFVFLEVASASERPGRGSLRQTGFMCCCASCGRTYPAELLACPACGVKDRVEEDTLTGSRQHDWALELAGEAVQRARAGGVPADVERILAHARLALEQRLAEGGAVPRGLLDGVGLAAAEVARGRGEASWGRWALSIYASMGLLPPPALSEQLSQLPESERRLLSAAAQRAAESARDGQSVADSAGLEALLRLIGSAAP